MTVGILDIELKRSKRGMLLQYRAQPEDKSKEESATEPMTGNIATEEGSLEINAIHGRPQPSEGQLALARTEKRQAKR